MALEAAEDLELAVVRAVEAAELAEEPATDRALELERGVEAVRARVRAAVLDLEAGRVVDLAVERAAAVEQDPVEGLAVERRRRWNRIRWRDWRWNGRRRWNRIRRRAWRWHWQRQRRFQ